MSIRSETSGAVTTIILDRPEKLNAFAGTMRQELVAALHAAEEDRSVRAVILTGAGRAFCAGGDVDTMSGLQKSGDTGAFGALLDAGRDVIVRIATMSKPVIAAVNGVAAGAGCNLALACDYRLASDESRFSQSFVRIGLHPDWAGTWFLPRLVGPSRAFELMTSGRMVPASEALSMGMVDRIVPAAELLAEAAAMAESLSAAPPLAVAGIKRALRRSNSNTLEEQLSLEKEHQLRCFVSADAAEGMAALAEKRTPKFEG
jgi:2-(1,2-epoxy-1,2-dihydrophenyl)acetyl-CoA isomerase